MNVPQLLTFGGGLLLIYSAIKNKSPLEVIKAGIAASKKGGAGTSPTAISNVTVPTVGTVGDVGTVPQSAQYNTTASPVAKFNQ